MQLGKEVRKQSNNEVMKLGGEEGVASPVAELPIRIVKERCGPPARGGHSTYMCIVLYSIRSVKENRDRRKTSENWPHLFTEGVKR
jgi:hypothetical protein